MTSDELDGLKKIDESRMRRIAKGSGALLPEVDMLLKMHKQFGKMFAGFGKSGLMKGSDANMMQQMQRNPNAVMQQLQRGMSGMDPRMRSQLGGAGSSAVHCLLFLVAVGVRDVPRLVCARLCPGGLMNMIKQMGGAGGPGGLGAGMPGLEEMQSMLKGMGLGGPGMGGGGKAKGKGKR